MTEKLEEELRVVLSYLACEALKARKRGKIDRAEKLSIAFKILSKEYDKIRRRGEGKGEN